MLEKNLDIENQLRKISRNTICTFTDFSIFSDFTHKIKASYLASFLDKSSTFCLPIVECCTAIQFLEGCFGAKICKSFSNSDCSSSALLFNLSIVFYLKICIAFVREVLKTLNLRWIWDGCIASISFK